MLQLVMLSLVLLLLCTGFRFILAGFRPGGSGNCLSEVIASYILFAMGSAIISLVVYVIDNTLHWWL